MPRNVKLSNGQTAQFPDEMDDNAILAVLQKQFPPQQSASVGLPGITPPKVDMQPMSGVEAVARGSEDMLANVVSSVAGPGTAIGNMVLPVMDRIFPNPDNQGRPGKLARQVMQSEADIRAGQQQARTSGNPISEALAPFSSAPLVNVSNLGISGQLPAGPVRGVAQGVEEFASSLTQPVNAVIGAAGIAAKANSVAQRLMSAGFSLDMINNAMKEMPNLKEAVEAGDYETAARLATSAAGSTVMASLAGSHAIAREKVPVMGSEVRRPTTPEGKAAAAAEDAKMSRLDSVQALPNDQLVTREAELASTAPEIKSQQPQELTDIRQEIANRQKQGGPNQPQIEPGVKLSRAQRRASVAIPEEGPSIEQQRIEAARQPIAERLGLDLAAASPEDLAAVDQLAKEGYIGTISRPTKSSNVRTPLESATQDSAVEMPDIRSTDRTPGSNQTASIPAPDPVVDPSPQPTAREPKTLPVYGRNTEILIPGERKKYAATYAVREAEDVIPSHNAQSFEPRADYQFKNDRNYSEPQNAERIVKQTAEFDPAFVVNDNPTAENGPPIIDWNGNVLGGNSRTMTLERVRNSSPEAIAAYKTKIAAEAKKLGLDPAAVEKMKNPVLVRQVVEDVADPQAAITDFNKVGTAELRQAERAIADSRRVTPKTLDEITRRIEDQGPDGTLAQALDGDAVDLVNRLTEDGVLTVQERPRLMNADGRLTSEGKQRMTRLLTGRLFEDARHFEDTAPELRQKVERIVAPLAKVEGVEGWDIADKTKEAIRLVEEARTRDLSIDELTSQRGMFGDKNYSAEAIAIAKKLQAKPTEVAKAFRQYAAEAELGASDQMMMGMEPPTAADSFRAAFRTVDQLKEDIKAQLGSERGSISGKRAKGPSLSQNLTELAGIYLREGVQKFSEFMAKVREVFGKVPSGAAAAWNAAKKLNQDLGRGNPERGSVRIEKGSPEEEAKLRSTASGSGGRGGRTTETAAAAGAEADPRGTGGEPVSNPDKLGGGKDRIITSPNLKKSRDSYIKKLGLDDSTIEQVEKGLADWEKTNPERRVMTFDDVRKEARERDPQLLKEMDRAKAQESVILDAGMRQAAKNAVNAISREQVSLRQRLSTETLVGEERAKLQRKYDQLEHDFRQLTDILIPTRSQIGRTLAFERIMAEQSFDVTYWLHRAKKAQAIPDEVALPEAQVEKIKEITKRGTDAEAAAVDRVQGGGKAKPADIEKQAREELGPEPGALQPAKTRVKPSERRAPEPKPKVDPTLEEKQARYKEQLKKKMQQLAEATPKEKKQSKWELTPEQRRQVEQDPEVQAAARELARTLRDLHKDGWMEYALAFRNLNLLTATGTHAKNMISNAGFQVFNEASRPMGMLADLAIRTAFRKKAAKERTVGGISWRAIKEAGREGATKGIEEAAEVWKTGEVPNDGTKLYDFSKELNARHLFENRPILKHLAWTNDALNQVGRSLKAEDRLFKRYAFRRSLEEQMAVAKVKVPTEEMMIEAWGDADFMTFNNKNIAAAKFTEAMDWAKRQELGGKAAYVAARLFLAFRNTPANVWMRTVEGSGLGLISGPIKVMTEAGQLTAKQQREIAMEIGRGATGLGLVAAGFFAYKNGYATGMYGDDERGEKALARTAGKPEGSLKLFDKYYVSLMGLSPVGNFINIGATLGRKYGEWSDFFTNPDEMLAIASATVKDQPMLRGVQDIIEAVQNRNNRSSSLAGSLAGSFVPSIVNEAGQMSDDVLRDTGGGNIAERMGKAVMGRTPGLRQMLPEKLDAVGRTIPQEKLGTLLGFPITKEDDRPALREMARVGVSMDNQKLKKGESEKLYQVRQRIAREKGELPPEKLPDEPRDVFRARVEGTGEAILNRVERLMGKRDYQSATDEEKQQQIESLVKKTRSQSSRFTKLESWSNTPVEQRKEWLIRRLR